MIEVRHLRKEYDHATPLTDFSCTIHEGDVIAIIGPSGCGKSTFLRCLNLLEQPTSGEILFEGKDILKGEMSPVDVHKFAGMVFQGFHLYPQYTALENIIVPQVDILKRSKQEAYDRAVEYLKMVDLFQSADKYPYQLSGGQKQRVAIARTLAMDNKVLLLDEPTSALDPIMVREVQYVIRKLAKSGRTMLIVTHEMRFAREIANRVFYMDGGVLYEEGTPEEIFQKPQRQKTWNFVNCVNVRSFQFDTSAFEYINCITEVQHFAERNNLPESLTNQLISVFEEVVAINLVPSLQGKGKVKVRMTYSEMTQKASFTIFTDQENRNGIEGADETSLALINSNVESINFMAPNEEPWHSAISLTIRNR